MTNYCTTADLAKLRGCSQRYIRKIIADGALTAIPAEESANNQKEYLIPLTQLTEREQWIFGNKQRRIEGLKPIPKPQSLKPKKAVDDFSSGEREELAMWKKIIEKWQLVRMRSSGKKADVDEIFCEMIRADYPGISISPAILYRKNKALQNGDISALINNRGKGNLGRKATPQILSDAFCYFYLDQRRLPIARCYALLQEWTLEFHPELIADMPCERTFRNIAAAIPEAVAALCRYGEKALSDKYIPYIERLYEDIEANDVWIADNHTFDFITVGDGGKRHRLYLTAFTDAKSGVMVGWNLTDNPSSQSTLLALGHGIQRFGIPRSVYFDNGSEFLVRDIGGRGHRRKKDWNNRELAPTILDTLGIEMHNALVRNAKAKPIERTFFTLKNHISRVIETFCGGTILERPESLKWKLKNGIVPEDQQIRDIFGTLIDGDYNVDEYGGKERRYKGKTRLEVWNESIKNVEFRNAAEEDLNLLLARVSRPQFVKRNGVFVDFAGEKLWYSGSDTVLHIGEKVYVRYDPADITSVRVYDFADDSYLYTWTLNNDMILPYIGAKPEEIADAERARRAAEKAVKNYSKGLTSSLEAEEKIDFLTITLQRAKRQKAEKYHVEQPTCFVPVVSDKLREQKPILQGVESITIDAETIDEMINIDRMNANAARRKKGDNYD